MQREKKIRGGELASDGVGMISSDGEEWQLFYSDGGGEMPDALHFPPPSHPISKQPGQLQLQMYSCIIYPLNLVQGLIQKF